MLIVFNQSPSTTVNINLTVPLYYSGLDTRTNVTRGSFDNKAESTIMELRRDWSIALPITMEPVSMAWFIFEEAE